MPPRVNLKVNCEGQNIRSSGTMHYVSCPGGDRAKAKKLLTALAISEIVRGGPMPDLNDEPRLANHARSAMGNMALA